MPCTPQGHTVRGWLHMLGVGRQGVGQSVDAEVVAVRYGHSELWSAQLVTTHASVCHCFFGFLGREIQVGIGQWGMRHGSGEGLVSGVCW
jgi:hypothetical protein